MREFICIALFITLLSCTKNQENQENQNVLSNDSVKTCSKEAKMCANGQVVGRNQSLNCQFDPCPQKNLKSKNLCTADVKQCSDGTFVGRDSNNNCQFPSCGDSLL